MTPHCVSIHRHCLSALGRMQDKISSPHPSWQLTAELGLSETEDHRHFFTDGRSCLLHNNAINQVGYLYRKFLFSNHFSPRKQWFLQQFSLPPPWARIDWYNNDWLWLYIDNKLFCPLICSLYGYTAEIRSSISKYFNYSIYYNF